MKRLYKQLLYAGLSVLMCSFTVLTAEAQRGSRSGGGGGGGSMRSGGGSGGGSRGAGVSRAPSYGGQRQPATVSRSPRTSSPQTYRAPSSRSGAPSSRSGAPSRVYSQRPSSSGAARVSRGGSGYYRGGNGSGTRITPYPRSGNRNYYNNRYYSNRYYYRGGRYYRYYPYRGFYYPYRGFYSSYYAPYLGVSIGVLPYGYYPFYWDNMWWYYSGGLYYQQQNNQYTVVEPPLGAEIKELPEGAQSIVINGVQYYELNGVYYQPVTKDDGTLTYMIAGKDGELNTEEGYDDVIPLVGDIEINLPAGSRKVSLNGETMYVSPEGIYYKEDYDANNNKVYRVVGVPSEENAIPAGE